MVDPARERRMAWRNGNSISIDDHSSIVHAICPYLRDFKPCEECPKWQTDEKYGKVTKGCYVLANEVMNICQTGHPHRHGEQTNSPILTAARRYRELIEATPGQLHPDAVQAWTELCRALDGVGK